MGGKLLPDKKVAQAQWHQADFRGKLTPTGILLYECSWSFRVRGKQWAWWADNRVCRCLVLYVLALLPSMMKELFEVPPRHSQSKHTHTLRDTHTLPWSSQLNAIPQNFTHPPTWLFTLRGQQAATRSYMLCCCFFGRCFCSFIVLASVLSWLKYHVLAMDILNLSNK